MSIRIYFLWALLLLGIFPANWVSSAEVETPRCIVCGRLVKPAEKYYVYANHPTLKKDVSICADCNEFKQHCAKCGLPVKETAERTGDGRYFCPIDFPLTALDETEIRQMFTAAAGSLVQLSGGKMALKNPNITVNVFDVDYWNSKAGENSQPAATMQRHGLSTSRPVGNGFVHTVLLYRGLSKAEMVAVCAHEYTHLWINENRAANRNIEPQTIEAVCEVVALALMESQQRADQVQAIMENGYTEGRIKGAAEYFHVHGLNRILDWVADGKEPVFNERDFQVSYSNPGAPAIWRTTGQSYRATFDKLQLKGVIGNKDKAVALINDKTFEKGEERKMDVGGKKLLVKLLEINEDTVLLQLEGSKEPLKLLRE